MPSSPPKRGLGRRLHTKLFLMMLVVGVLPLVAAGAVVYVNIIYSHRANIAAIEGSLLQQKRDEVAAEISNVVENVFALIVNVSANDDPGSLRTVLGLFIESQPRFLEQFLVAHASLTEVAFISLHTESNISGQNVTVGKESARYVRSTHSGEPVPVAASALRDQSRLEKFQVAREGKTYFGPTYYTLRGPMMTVASPVRDKEGEILAVLSGELNLLRVGGLMEGAKLGSTGYLYLVDRDGFLIGKSSGDRTERSMKSTPFVQRVLAGNEAIGVERQERYASFFGSEVVAAGLFLPETSWALIAEWPTADADRILRDALLPIMTFTLFALAAIIVASVFFARRIVGPVRTLEAGTKRIAQGKFDEPITLVTGDEIEELGVAFNEMMKGLKRLQELKDEFVFVAAHELRTPVAAMKGYLTLMMQGIAGPVSEQLGSFIIKVMTANARLIRLVDDLLEVARSEAGRLTITVRPVEIEEPIRASVSELKPLADEKGIALNYVPVSGLPKVVADADRLKEVMVNIVGNAIKYTLGQGEITITHEVRDGTLVTHVGDRGIGIPKEAQQKIFEKFYRVQSAETKNITGTGLGLFIVKQILEKMNGSIWFTSEPGKGSVFSFNLPLAPQ